MFCKSCGKLLKETDKFCSKCKYTTSKLYFALHQEEKKNDSLAKPIPRLASVVS